MIFSGTSVTEIHQNTSLVLGLCDPGYGSDVTVAHILEVFDLHDLVAFAEGAFSANCLHFIKSLGIHRIS